MMTLTAPALLDPDAARALAAMRDDLERIRTALPALAERCQLAQRAFAEAFSRRTEASWRLAVACARAIAAPSALDVPAAANEARRRIAAFVAENDDLIDDPR